MTSGYLGMKTIHGHPISKGGINKLDNSLAKNANSNIMESEYVP